MMARSALVSLQVGKRPVRRSTPGPHRCLRNLGVDVYGTHTRAGFPRTEAGIPSYLFRGVSHVYNLHTCACVMCECSVHPRLYHLKKKKDIAHEASCESEA